MLNALNFYNVSASLTYLDYRIYIYTFCRGNGTSLLAKDSCVLCANIICVQGSSQRRLHAAVDLRQSSALIIAS